MLRLTLPLHPSINPRHGDRRLARTAENYIRISKAMIDEAIEDQPWLKQTRAVLYLDCVFFMPDRRIRDSHNMLKLLLDMMQPHVFENDYFVLPLVQHVGLDKENPRVDVLITVQTKNQAERGLKQAGMQP